MTPTDRDTSSGEGKSAIAEPPESTWGRAARHNLRLPLRYRLEGQPDWRYGETLNISESGLLFSSNEVLEVNAKVEITFQTAGIPLLHSSTRQVRLVRRTLCNWPETRLLFGARFLL